MTTGTKTSAATEADRVTPFLATPLGSAVCIAVSAICYFIAIRFIDLWPIALFAPMPMLAAAFAAPSRARAVLCAFIPIFVGCFGLWSAESFFLSTVFFVTAYAALSLVVSGLVLIARAAARRWSNAGAALVFPILYAALSFVFSRTTYDGTWADPSYRMDGFLAILQLASITGIWGIVFAMTLPASGIAFAWYRLESGRPWRAPTAVALGIFGAVLIFGFARLATAPHTRTVRVAMIASDHEIPYSRTTDEAKAADLLTFYAAQIPKAAAQGAQVVVLPEKIVGVTAEDQAALQTILSGAASSSHVWLIAGVNEIGSAPKIETVKINAAKINAAWIFSPDGAFVGEYHKHYFVTGFEAGYQSGKRIEVLDAPWGKTAVAICKDLDYPWFIRGYGAKDATVMFVPAWDWEGPNAVMHERMATVRGVENGFAMARSAKTGFVTAHDAYGRTLASSSTFAADPAMVVADIPLGPGTTPYSRLGDWFGWLCIIASLVILVTVLTPRAGSSRAE